MVAWGLVLALVSGVALYLGTDFVHERVGQVVRTLQESGPDQQASNSTDDRRLVWRAAAGVVAAHPWSGVGTGDVKDELLKVYAERGYAEPLRKKLNAHDQYLNTGVALGIGGMLLLLLMVVVPTAFAARKRQVLLISFLLLNALNWRTGCSNHSHKTWRMARLGQRPPRPGRRRGRMKMEVAKRSALSRSRRRLKSSRSHS